MPAIIGTDIFKHPSTLESGLWFNLCTGPKLTGLNDTKIGETKLVGMTKEQFQTALNTRLQALCETSSDFIQNPIEPGCRVEGKKYICQVVKIKVGVKSINPIVLEEIVIEEAASRAVNV